MLRVLTLNLWRDAGPWPARAALIRTWLERLGADLIAFQEAARSTEVDLKADLLHGLPHVLAADAAGNAIASRWPIARVESAPLPGGEGAETRSALLCEVASPHGSLVVCTTHLDWGPARAAARARQIAALSALVRAHALRVDLPPILAGDFNAEPASDEIRGLTGRRARWIDAWSAAGDGGPGHTWASRNPYARLAGERDRRIDYIFVGPPGADGRGRVASCRVVCDESRQGVFASDHFGVYAELRTESG